MTEGGYGADGTTVDAVAGQLASRLGAIGETAGEVMRRDVRTAAGGAESIALLARADADGAGRIAAATAGEHPVGRGATTPVEQVPTAAAVREAEPAETPRPSASAVTEESSHGGGAQSRPVAEPVPEQPGDRGPGRTGSEADDAAAAAVVQSVDGGHGSHSPADVGIPQGGAAGEVDGGADHPAGPAAVGNGYTGTSGPEEARLTAEPAQEAAKATEPVVSGTTPEPDRPGPGPEPVVDAAGKNAANPGASGGPAGPPAPGTSTIAVADSPAESPATEPATRQSSGPAGSTPWTPDLAGTGSGAGQSQLPGSTPWNSGAGSSMPYMPGLPGGLMSSLTPQERPPRGSAPWSRGRGTTQGGGTVFPRERPDDRQPGGRG